MNIDTGELYRLTGKELEELEEQFGDKIQQVPRELIKEANGELNGNLYTRVNMSKSTPLTNWAKKERKKRKRKIAKKSKQRNRRK